jgi:hypothetical protein
MISYPGLAVPPARWRKPPAAALDYCHLVNLWAVCWPLVFVQVREAPPATVLSLSIALMIFGMWRSITP